MPIEQFKEAFWYSAHGLASAIILTIIVTSTILLTPLLEIIADPLYRLMMNGEIEGIIYPIVLGFQFIGAIIYAIYRKRSGDFMKNGFSEIVSFFLAIFLPGVTTILSSLIISLSAKENKEYASSLRWVPLPLISGIKQPTYWIIFKTSVRSPKAFFQGQTFPALGRYAYKFGIISIILASVLQIISKYYGPRLVNPWGGSGEFNFGFFVLSGIGAEFLLHILIGIFILVAVSIIAHILKLFTGRRKFSRTLKTVSISTAIFPLMWIASYLQILSLDLANVVQIGIGIYFLYMVCRGIEAESVHYGN